MTDLSLTPRSSGAPTVLGEGRRRSSRLLRALALVLIASGALAVIDAAVTLLWQEPVSALIASLRQDHLQKVLHQEERALPTPVERRALASIGDERRRIGYLAGELERHAGDGGPVGRIVIPRIGASFVLIKGTNTEDLKGGPGVDTNLPGVGETTLIAGHRTTYLAPFRHIDALAPGNHILLKMPYARFTYTVVAQRVVSPRNVQAAVAEVGYTRVVLSACTPVFTAEKRLLVFARLTRTVPVGAARLLPGGAVARPIDAHTQTAAAAAALPAVFESLDPRLLGTL
jgi:sortase A